MTHLQASQQSSGAASPGFQALCSCPLAKRPWKGHNPHLSFLVGEVGIISVSHGAVVIL